MLATKFTAPGYIATTATTTTTPNRHITLIAKISAKDGEAAPASARFSPSSTTYTDGGYGIGPTHGGDTELFPPFTDMPLTEEEPAVKAHCPACCTAPICGRLRRKWDRVRMRGGKAPWPTCAALQSCREASAKAQKLKPKKQRGSNWTEQVWW